MSDVGTRECFRGKSMFSDTVRTRICSSVIDNDKKQNALNIVVLYSKMNAQPIEVRDLACYRQRGYNRWFLKLLLQFFTIRSP